MVRTQKLATFNVDPELWEAFKAKAIESGGNATSVLLSFVRQYVSCHIDNNLDTDIDSNYIDNNLDNNIDKKIRSYIDTYLDDNLYETVSVYLDDNLDKYLDKHIDNDIDADLDSLEFNSEKGFQEDIDKNIDANLDTNDDSVNLEVDNAYIICRLEDKKVVEIWGKSQAWVKVKIALHPKVTVARKYETESSVKTQLGKLRKKFPNDDLRWNTLGTVMKLIEAKYEPS